MVKSPGRGGTTPLGNCIAPTGAGFGELVEPTAYAVGYHRVAPTGATSEFAVFCGTGFQPVRSIGQVENLSHRKPYYFAGANFTHTGEPTSAFWSVAFSWPVVGSMRKTTMLSEP